MTDRLSEQAASIGALAEPLRRDLYAYVVSQPEPVSREQAAEGVQVALHTAKFHLDRLVDEGLLEVEFRRLSGRTGPGAGRPAKMYRRSSRELSVSLPARRYDLAGRILASGVERARQQAGNVDEAIAEAAADEGRRAGTESAARGSEVQRAGTVLADLGYEPTDRDGGVVLANCPFDALAREHTTLICGVNEAFVGGLLDGLGCSGLEARLEPHTGLCCVRVDPRRS